ncbi:B12-binding domain-containing radical SAM protein [Gracilinema caldarium]|uniref:Radical SAM domain protein n=1 Tax=Gracilinema caldarium (strain ATCC 51460 / DSM 7334 / H1) TaxID=744872 RepID=F8F194_GRAC1|nr:B12-binding domain-containing radical SAM protein [Gracilinema caldarium]AEJ18738.1 Radical SAM domain protein [Gracilinema caldarium DSM 7334]
MTEYSLIFISIHCEQSPDAVALGAASVASFVQARFTRIRILDAYVDESPSQIFERLFRLCSGASGPPETLGPQEAHRQVVGFSLYSWNRKLSLTVAALCREAFPDCFLVAGGPEVSARPEGLSTTEGGPFSVLIRGEGESAFQKVLEAWSAGIAPCQTIIDGKTEDITQLPSPWLSGLLKGKTTALWELARGCPYACSYCYESKGNHRLRYISEERFHQELDYFVQKQMHSVFVLDPTFNANNKRTLQILDRLIEKAPNIHWHFEVRAELLNRDQARRFAQLGASLQIGLQTADPEVSARLNRPLELAKFKQKIDILNQEGVVFGLDLIYGLPGDTLEGFLESLNVAINLYPNHLDIFRLAILPGTVLAEEASHYDMNYETEPPYTLRSSASFSRQDMDRAERLARAVDFFYNKGRAVPWFNQVLYPLHKTPAQLFLLFANFMDAKKKPWDANVDPSYPASREAIILEFLHGLFEKQKLDYLLPAVWDVVRFHGAWARALAEGITTTIDCNYDPDQLFGAGVLDLEEFCALADMNPTRIRVKPGRNEPEVSIIS